MRQKGLGAVDDSPEVDVDDALDVFELGVLDLAVVGDAGVVEHRVDAAEVCGDGLGVVQNGLALSHIEGLGVHLGPGLADQALGGGQAGGVDVGDGQLGAQGDLARLQAR